MDKQSKDFRDHMCERSRNSVEHFSLVMKKAFRGKIASETKYLETFKSISDCSAQFANLIGLTEEDPIEGIDHDSVILTLEMMDFSVLKVEETLDNIHDYIEYKFTVGITDTTGEFIGMDYKVFAIKNLDSELLELKWKLRNAALPYLFDDSDEDYDEVEDEDDSDDE